ncbi:MAG: crossover junction endodeoxyribonuclease RuvC [Patescibacteria group bacterium]
MQRHRDSILALDPGTREMGYASFDGDELVDYGVKSIRHGRVTAGLLLNVDRIVSRMIRQKQPRVLVIEKNTFSQIQQNVRLVLAIARIKAVARRYRLRAYEYDSRTIRKAVCNDGNATKRELARTIAVRYPEMRAYLESNRRWRERYYQNSFDAIACGLTFRALHCTFTTSI